MRDLTHYFTREAPDGTRRVLEPDVAQYWQRRAGERAARLRHRDERVTALIDELVVERTYDVLLLGWADAASHVLRAELIGRASAAMRARFDREDPERDRVITEYAELDVAARFRRYTPDLQKRLSRFEAEWGYARDLVADTSLAGTGEWPGYERASFLTLERHPEWGAIRVADGRPTDLPLRQDSARFRVPHSISIRPAPGELVLVELWVYPRDADGDHAAWEHLWFLLQDEARLVPQKTDQATADVIADGLLADLARIAASANHWRIVRENDYMTVARKYLRDGSPLHVP